MHAAKRTARAIALAALICGFATCRTPHACGAQAPHDRSRILLDENFEDHAAVANNWQTLIGSWKIHAPTDELAELKGSPPMFSVYTPKRDVTCLAATGEPHWANLDLRTVLRFEETKTAGLAFNIRDERNFHAFVITPGAERTGNATLIECRNGQTTKLRTTQRLSIDNGQWYGLKIETFADQARCSILGLPATPWKTIFAGSLPAAATGSGRLGLFSSGNGVLFDHVSAKSRQSFADTLATANPKLWKPSGDWATRAGMLAGSGNLRLVRRRKGPRRIDVELHAAAGSEAAIFTHSPNEKSYYAFGLFAGEWQFRRVINSVPSVLAKTPAPGGESHLISLINRAGVFYCLVDDRPIFNVCAAALPDSPDFDDGLMAKDAAFRNFQIVEDPERAGVEIFATDFRDREGADKIRMARGAIVPDILEPSGPGWHPEKQDERTVFLSDGPGTLLFRTPLRGDVSVAATVSRKGGAAVVLAAGSEQGAYRLALDRNGANVALHRGNKRIALPIAIAGEAGKVTLELTKRGPEILASVDSKPVLKFTDLHPLAAGRAGLAASGCSAFFDLTIRAESAAFYPFKTASPRWRESGGEWIIRAGIPDPTLGHWITGIARKRTGYLWERIERRGDFAWHVTVAPATEGYIDGGSVTFPLENVRLSFCSRLGQPESGYCVVIRPNGRDSIALLSANEPAVENEFLPPKGKPVRVSITRRQSKIEIRIDQSKVIEFDDPDPPAAGHLGLGVKNSRANFLDVLIMPIN